MSRGFVFPSNRVGFLSGINKVRRSGMPWDGERAKSARHEKRNGANMKRWIACAIAAFLAGGNAMESDGKIGNLSKARRDRLVAEVGAIRAYLEKSAGADTNATRLLKFAAELEKEVLGKKYGLVFEEHRERVDVELDENLPVLKEVKNRFVSRGGAEARSLNFLIEGDNLAALKLLEKTHRGKIDLIYIDPPYNTGNRDFIYNDSYVEATDGFRHSKWLSFMEKRLKMAKTLLSDGGVIFISLNDIEQPNCRVLCDTIFGESNFCGQIIWRKKSGGGQTDDFFVTEHEYVLVYRKTTAFKWIDELIHFPYENLPLLADYWSYSNIFLYWL